MNSSAEDDAVDAPHDGSIDLSSETNGAQRSKKEQRRLAKAQYRAQQKAARAEAVANGDDTSAFRQRKRRSQRDCNRQGVLKQRLLAAGIADTDSLDHAPAKQRSAKDTPQVTYVPCTSNTCGSSHACCLRVVAPYVHRFETFAKARWCGRTLHDVFSSDFAGLPADYCPRAIAAGLIRINGERCDAAYVIRNGDLLTHTVHRHEPPVHLPVRSASTSATAAHALVQYETDDVVVVDKPSSLPVHPSGAYLHNAVTEVLETECSVPELFPVHRLDRLTSGLLLFAKSSVKARELCDAIASGNVQKHYVARVVGTFPPVPPSEKGIERVDLAPVDFSDLAQLTRVEVDGAMYWKLSAPIGCISSAAHRQGVTRDGNSKDAVTLFRRRSVDGAHSVVECLPITGRTHQIRVHLQFLGFPIVNDPEYGPESAAKTLADDRTGEETQDAAPVDFSTLEPTDGITDELALCEAICPACRDGDDSIFSATQRQVFTLWLHSFKYASSKWAFEVPLPQWASN